MKPEIIIVHCIVSNFCARKLMFFSCDQMRMNVKTSLHARKVNTARTQMAHINASVNSCKSLLVIYC